jgi:hypothetical protein
MIPMRTSTIFKSRWWALIWAAGIIWLAVDVAGTGKSTASASNNQSSNTVADADGQAASSDDVNTAANALGL